MSCLTGCCRDGWWHQLCVLPNYHRQALISPTLQLPRQPLQLTRQRIRSKAGQDWIFPPLLPPPRLPQVRFQEVPPETPTGCTGLTHSAGELERRCVAGCGQLICCSAAARQCSAPLPLHLARPPTHPLHPAVALTAPPPPHLIPSFQRCPVSPHPLLLCRFQELERGLQASAAEVASVREVGASLGEYRATLDVASQQMALVLEMLQKDVEQLK